ncbi:hypothetical protein CWI84_00510 [Idiomarina tyrosinivorans]|uniref:Lipoprotein n=1 Tax=Idiomarina tyrosinivorans TaxID=1445662 RepID=A0A432ZTX7_9GAMM|nr:DUF6279 family lipoprotein [Idiomarina tyrosinivorans]RUO81278.1 hypothetical protein CWI84_00510 [Idiomarina tyrosinivorans]
MRRAVLLVVAVIASLLAGCGSQIGYHFADTYIEWQIDDYVDLTDTQQQTVSDALDQLHHWHATEELPTYQSTLQSLRDKIANNSLTKADINAIQNAMLDAWKRIRGAIVLVVGKLYPTLTSAQKQQIISKMREKVKERRQDYNSERETERQLARFDDIADDLSDWLGDLTTAQKHRLGEFAKHSDDRTLWFDYQDAWIDALEQVVSYADKQRSLASVKALILKPETLRSEALKQQISDSSTRRLSFIWQTYKSMSSIQRVRVLNKLDGYINLLAELSADFH